MSDLLARAAHALEDDPRVMASALASRRRATGLSVAAQEAWLGMVPGHLPRLDLCRRPDPTSATFGDEAAALAAYVRCAAERLRQMLEWAAGAEPAVDAEGAAQAARERRSG